MNELSRLDFQLLGQSPKLLLQVGCRVAFQIGCKIDPPFQTLSYSWSLEIFLHPFGIVSKISHEEIGPVFGKLGQQVATLFDGPVDTGRSYTVRLLGTRLASGVYFYRLQSGNQSALKKLVIAK